MTTRTIRPTIQLVELELLTLGNINADVEIPIERELDKLDISILKVGEGSQKQQQIEQLKLELEGPSIPVDPQGAMQLHSRGTKLNNGGETSSSLLERLVSNLRRQMEVK